MKTMKTTRATPTQQRFVRNTISVAILSAMSGQMLANPLNPQVVAGQASFTQAGNQLVIQNAPNTIINWQQFNIGAGEVTKFIQQNAQSAVLNRVTGGDISQILGTLQSNGRVFLINPNGLMVGAGARIDVAGLVASTLNISNQDFLAGRLNFTGQGGEGALKNAGQIVAGQGGQVVLVAPQIENSGIINAPNGDVLLAAGRSVTVVDVQRPTLSVDITAPANQILNLGSIIAGQVSMYGQLVRHEGVIEATGLTTASSGAIRLVGQQGTTLVSGQLTASGAAGKGGTIDVLGDQVGVLAGARIHADGANGGGQVHLGGGWQGQDPSLPNAKSTYVDAAASVTANALSSGHGGEVVAWSDQYTAVNSALQAKGGPLGGDGGRIETSSKGVLNVTAGADTSAPKGKAGQWLLDPQSIEIVAPSPTNPPASPSSFFSPTSDQTKIGSDVIVSSLQNNGNVTLSTVGSTGATDGRITVSAPVLVPTLAPSPSASPITSFTLTLQAEGGVYVNAPLGVTDPANSVLNLDLQFGPSFGAMIAAPLTLGAGQLAARYSTGFAPAPATTTPQPLAFTAGVNASGVQQINAISANLPISSTALQRAPDIVIDGANVVANSLVSNGGIQVGGTSPGTFGVRSNGFANKLKVGAGSIFTAGGLLQTSNGSTFASSFSLNTSNTIPLNVPALDVSGTVRLVNATGQNVQPASGSTDINLFVNGATQINSGGMFYGDFGTSAGFSNNTGNTLPTMSIASGGSLTDLTTLFVSQGGGAVALNSLGTINIGNNANVQLSGNVNLGSTSVTTIGANAFLGTTNANNSSTNPSTVTLSSGGVMNVNGFAFVQNSKFAVNGTVNVGGQLFGNISAPSPSAAPTPAPTLSLATGSVVNVNPGGTVNLEGFGVEFGNATINLNGLVNNPAVAPPPVSSNGSLLRGGILNTPSMSFNQITPGSVLQVNATGFDNVIGGFQFYSQPTNLTIGQGIQITANGTAFASQPTGFRYPTLFLRSQLVNSQSPAPSPSSAPSYIDNSLPFVNLGSINANSGIIKIDATGFTNNGSISIGANGDLRLAAPTTSAQLFALNRASGSSLSISKSLNNSGTAFNLDQTGSLRFQEDTIVTGGSFSGSTGTLSVVDDAFVTFRGVTVSSRVNMGYGAGLRLSYDASGTPTTLSNGSISFNRGYAALLLDPASGATTARLIGSGNVIAASPGNFILATNSADTIQFDPGIAIQTANPAAGTVFPIPKGITDAGFSVQNIPGLTIGRLTKEAVASIEYDSMFTAPDGLHTTKLSDPIPASLTLDGYPGLNSVSPYPNDIPITFITQQNIINQGTITSNGVSIDFGGGTLTNYGSMVISQSQSGPGTLINQVGGALAFAGNSSITVQKNIVNTAGGSVVFTPSTGAVAINGSYSSDGQTTFGAGNTTFAGAYTQNAGTTTLMSGSVVNCVNSSGMSIIGGMLNGSGSINGNLSVGTGGSQAILSPGFSPGTLNVSGNLTMGSNSTTLLDIGGSVAGVDYDQIVVGGVTSLGGALQLIPTAAGISPSTNYNLFSSGTLTGSFASTSFGSPLTGASISTVGNMLVINNVSTTATSPAPAPQPAPQPSPQPAPQPAPAPVSDPAPQPAPAPTPDATQQQATQQVDQTVLAQTTRPTATSPSSPPPPPANQQSTTDDAKKDTNTTVTATTTSAGPANNIQVQPRQSTVRASSTCR